MVSRTVLSDLLKLVINHWGAKAVFSELHRIDPDAAERYGQGVGRGQTGSAKRRLTPTELARKLDIPSKRRAAIVDIAALYETKAFLPTIGDVRMFLEAREISANELKSRDQAFRHILKLLEPLPQRDIEQIRNSATHSGPMRLAPLAEAIGAASDEIRARSRIAAPRQERPKSSSSG
jgi:hypothetical protein